MWNRSALNPHSGLYRANEWIIISDTYNGIYSRIGLSCGADSASLHIRWEGSVLKEHKSL